MVAGIDIPMSMRAKSIVQVNSKKVLSSNFAASTPSFFLYLNRMKAIALSTATPMAKQIQNMVMCRPKISCPRAVAPGDIFTSSQPANAGRDTSGKANRIVLKIVITRNVLD